MASNVCDSRPRIGISTYTESARWGVWDREAVVLPTSYVTAVHRAGGVPVLLPILADGEDVVLSAVDGLVLAGGSDVDPARYGQEPHESVKVRANRDDWEFRLLHAALERDLPVLAVCRGAQVFNVAFGGTLQQHLPEVVRHWGHQPAPATFGRTTVHVRPGSRTANILGEHVEVSCYHHQALDEVAAELDVVGTADDATVEAVELRDRRFALGVQWHPEEDSGDVRLFEALAAASADSHSGGDTR